MKIKDQLDAMAATELTLLILTRLDFIDEIYPRQCSAERMDALRNLIHLIKELGYNPDDFSPRARRMLTGE